MTALSNFGQKKPLFTRHVVFCYDTYHPARVNIVVSHRGTEIPDFSVPPCLCVRKILAKNSQNKVWTGTTTPPKLKLWFHTEAQGHGVLVFSVPPVPLCEKNIGKKLTK